MRHLLVALALALPRPAAAQARPVVHQRAVGQLGPTGVEHALALGVRAELGDPRELLFTDAHAEAGVVNYTSPIYSSSGGYLEVSPLAFLVLRATLVATAVWPVGQDGAGYFPSQSPALPPLDGALGATAHGWSGALSAILQGAVPLGPLRAILWDELSLEHVRLGEAPYHYSARHDAVLARDDDVLGNWAMALLEIPLDAGLALRLGAYDDVRHVPRSGALYHQLGGAVMLSATRIAPEVGELLAFVRAGAYERHERRAGELAMLAGVLVRYELEPRRGRAQPLEDSRVAIESFEPRPAAGRSSPGRRAAPAVGAPARSVGSERAPARSDEGGGPARAPRARRGGGA